MLSCTKQTPTRQTSSLTSELKVLLEGKLRVGRRDVSRAETEGLTAFLPTKPQQVSPLPSEPARDHELTMHIPPKKKPKLCPLSINEILEDDCCGHLEPFQRP